jgi:hypothetical protein
VPAPLPPRMYADTRIERRAVAARRPNVSCSRHDRREELTEYHQFFDGQCVVERSEGAADKHPVLPPAAGMAQDPLSLGGSYHNPRVVDVGEVGRLLVSGLSVSCVPVLERRRRPPCSSVVDSLPGDRPNVTLGTSFLRRHSRDTGSPDQIAIHVLHGHQLLPSELQARTPLGGF